MAFHTPGKGSQDNPAANPYKADGAAENVTESSAETSAQSAGGSGKPAPGQAAQGSVEADERVQDKAAHDTASQGIVAPAEHIKAASPAPAFVGRELAVTKIDPTSALKVGFMLNLALFAVWMVAATLIYLVLGMAGVWDKLNSLVGDLTGNDAMGAGVYFGAVAALGLLELVIFTLMAPLFALMYNSAATIIGGLRVTVDR